MWIVYWVDLFFLYFFILKTFSENVPLAIIYISFSLTDTEPAMLCKPGSETLHAETHPADPTVSAAPDQWGSCLCFI